MGEYYDVALRDFGLLVAALALALLAAERLGSRSDRHPPMTAATVAAASWLAGVPGSRGATGGRPGPGGGRGGEFLEALGLPLDSESMLETPGRMARAYTELLTVPDFDLTHVPQ